MEPIGDAEYREGTNRGCRVQGTNRANQQIVKKKSSARKHLTIDFFIYGLRRGGQFKNVNITTDPQYRTKLK